MKNLEVHAIGIVAQLFDLAEVPVKKRQEINDRAYDYVLEQLIDKPLEVEPSPASHFSDKEKVEFAIIDVIEDIQQSQVESGGRFLRQVEIKNMTVEDLLRLTIVNNVSYKINHIG